MEDLLVHRAVRVDQALQRWRARRARDAGKVPEVVPYTGYGSTSWLRVLARVLLARPTERRGEVPTGARGWRNFIGVSVENAQVSVVIPEPSMFVPMAAATFLLAIAGVRHGFARRRSIMIGQ